eukprot:TRINITY_DN1326_c0_g1_i1.p1 TRINITY_DN1326_c0_g1~~TRINITY_DN1326_c0_g1_i1.p1  ORF type:complete len:259 (-),score=59.95 TRINITY_DN1326_c0_g1_i1:74-850(-)
MFSPLSLLLSPLPLCSWFRTHLRRVDDIEDNSLLRRGVPVTHFIYGIPTTINTANYMYFIAMEQGRALGGDKALSIILDEFLNLHRGQGWDIYWRDNHICPTEEQYKQMVLDKTAGLFRLALKLMQIFSDNKEEEFIPLVNLMGVYYQIRDDYINLQSVKYAQNKSFAEDLTEGKYSFPIIHGINSRADHQLGNILKQRTTNDDLKRHAISLMEECGSFKYTLEVMEGLSAEIDAKIKALGGNKVLEHMMDVLRKNEI